MSKPTDFPLPSYSFPIDKVRHWIFSQGECEFTAEDVAHACNVNAQNFLRRLEERGEIKRVLSTNRAPVTYRRTNGLWWSAEQAAETLSDQDKLATQIGNLLDLTIFDRLYVLVRRWRSEALPGAEGKQARHCADDLEHELERLRHPAK